MVSLLGVVCEGWGGEGRGWAINKGQIGQK